MNDIQSRPGGGDSRPYDAVIVGGGPAGLNAALVLGNACRKAIVIDAGNPRNAPACELRNYLGRDGVDPADLLADGQEEIRAYGVEFVKDRIHSVCPAGEEQGGYKTLFEIEFGPGRRVKTRKLLLATGIEDQLPGIEGLESCFGISAHVCPYCGAWEYRQKHLLVLAEPCEKLEGLVQSLAGWTDRITALTNGECLAPKVRGRFEACEVDVATERIVRFVHENGHLRGVELAGKKGLLFADAVFLAAPERPRSDLARALGCRMKSEGKVKKTSRQKTSVPGVFVAGDVDGDTQFAIVAAAEGAIAAVNLNRELQEEDVKVRIGNAARSKKE